LPGVYSKVRGGCLPWLGLGVGTLPMARATAIINALLWVALGCFCVYATLEEGRVGGFAVVVAVFGAGCILNGLAFI
jgi:hypothetical protein